MHQKEILWIVFFVNLLISVNLFAQSTDGNEAPRFDCVIRASQFVELSSQVRGILESVDVDRGDVVKKDQMVAKLMAGVERASVRLAKARAKMNLDVQTRKAEKIFRQSTFKQVEELYKKNLASLREYDDAKTLSIVSDFELKKAKELRKLATLELERTEETLNLRYIKSPIDGVVVERMKSPGEYIEEQPVIKIAKIDPLHVEVIVPEEKFNQIKVGMKAKIYTQQSAGTMYDALVTIVDPIIDSTSGTFGVRLSLPNPDHKIPVGLRCEAVFDLK